MRHLPTLSGLSRVSRCPGSCCLPRASSWSEDSARGSAMHEVQELRARGLDVDLAAIANRWELDGDARNGFLELAELFGPDIPEGATPEIALGLFENGTVKDVLGGRGSYAPLPGLVLAGTIDVCWPDGMGGGVVADYKSSDANTSPIDQNLQLLAGAYLAASFFGWSRVTPMICFMTPGSGTWEMGKTIGLEELDELGERIEGIVEEVRGSDRLCTGPHCKFCPSASYCPPYLSEARALLVDGAGDMRAALTVDEARRLCELLPRARSVLESAENALKAHVRDHGPIQLSNGQEWGPEVTQADEWDPLITFDALSNHIDPGNVHRAFATNKTRIYDAISAGHDAAGLKRHKKAAFDRVRSEVEEAGGITTKTTERWARRWPGK